MDYIYRAMHRHSAWTDATSNYDKYIHGGYSSRYSNSSTIHALIRTSNGRPPAMADHGRWHSILHYCMTALVYHCNAVLLYYYITVLLYCCITSTVLLYSCIAVLLYYCITALQYYCIYCSITVLLSYCRNVQLHDFITVSLSYCITA